MAGSLTCAASHPASTTMSLRGSPAEVAPVIESANKRHATANDDGFMGCSASGLAPQCTATPVGERHLQPTVDRMRPTGALRNVKSSRHPSEGWDPLSSNSLRARYGKSDLAVIPAFAGMTS